MTSTKVSQHAPLGGREIRDTTEWLAAHQKDSGEIPWTVDGKTDPWDHVHAAMGLTVMGRVDAARKAYGFMAGIQEDNGAWAAERMHGKVTRAAQESNHAAYIATGVWHFYRATGDLRFLREMWPCVERAIDFVVDLQLPCGGIAWAVKKGKAWKAPLVTGSSSIHGSLVCAIRIAQTLGLQRPRWHNARARVALVLRQNMAAFTDTDLPEKPGRHSMDWYYPVLGGAVRGAEARRRLLDPGDHGDFVQEGAGCRCVRDKPWYTVAETCELVLALDAAGLSERARQVLSWTRWQRTEHGAYWTGTTHPDGVVFPDGEQTTWTAAAVLIAFDAVHLESATSDFFRSLDGADLSAPRPSRARPQPGYEELSSTPAE